MNEFLRGRRILLVARDYFFYTREIAAELQAAAGVPVSFVPIEPPGLTYKLLNKMGLASRRVLQRYHRRAVARLAARTFDIVVFIQVHQIGDMVGRYRDAFSSATFVLYYWDSLSTHDYLPYVRFFDRVFTFDPVDCKQHGELRYLPLFYSERFRSLRGERNRTHDLAFVGAAVSTRRYEQLERFRAWARANGVSLYDYLVVSPFLYVRQLLKGRRMRNVHFRGLSENRLLQVYGGARAILDLPNNTQSGYTMRTFEALGAHRKLVTTQSAVANEAFYSPDWVFILGESAGFPSRAFLDSPATRVPDVEGYSLRAWIGELLGDMPPGGRSRTDTDGRLMRTH